MEEKKTGILAILEILKKYSDENHILSQPDIATYLLNEYGIDLERRTICNNIHSLVDFGYDISTFEENRKGYYLRDREFEKGEVFLLCNAINSSPYIPSSNSKELINKILNTQSLAIQDEFKNNVYISNDSKRENKEFIYNIETIGEAIKNKKVISFHYMQYNSEKKLVRKREERYIYSPYYLVQNDSKTFLVCRNINHENLTHFRVDKIKDVRIEDNVPYIRLNKNEKPLEYARSKIYMFGGNSESIAIKCSYDILDNVLDIFGKETIIREQDSQHFIAYIKSSIQGVIYLALQYINSMEIIEPKEARDQMTEYLTKGIAKYQR